MPKFNVFVSHSRIDPRWAKKFAKELSGEGIEVWLDETNVDLDSSAKARVEKALKDSETVVLLIDKDNAKSPNLFFEFGAALAMGKKVLPVILGNVDPSDLPFDLKQQKALKRLSPDEVAAELIALKK
jgi:hypothetical protein